MGDIKKAEREVKTDRMVSFILINFQLKCSFSLPY